MPLQTSRPITSIPPQLFPRIDTAANLTSADPTLMTGQFGYESDTGLMKMGDGATAWASLPYVMPQAATSDGTTGGTGSAGAGTQYVSLTIGGTTYKVLHDGPV
jgi:hypothetical protein